MSKLGDKFIDWLNKDSTDDIKPDDAQKKPENE